MEEVRGPGGPWTVAGDSEGEVLMVSVRGLVLAIGGGGYKWTDGR